MVYVLFGVSGCGKSLIGQLLAEKLKIDFYDADDFHSLENVSKMSNGIALDDCDRALWLSGLNKKIHYWNSFGDAVLACSALKYKYRDMLAKDNEVTFVLLSGSFTLIKERLDSREDHFFNPVLLQSQFDDLEFSRDEIVVSVDDQPSVICSLIIKSVNPNVPG